MNTSSNEPVMGKSYSEKIDAFKSDLETIAQRHKDFFDSRPSQLDPKEHDHLSNHYIIDADNTKAGFRFQPNSDLPDEIKEECLCAYRKEFGETE